MDDLRTLAEKQQVVETITELFVYTDRRDWPAVLERLAPEVFFDMSSLTGSPPATVPAKEIVAGWERGLAPLEAVHHQAGNFTVSVRGDEAEAFCYATASHYLPNPTGRNTRVFVGSYDFALAKEGARWLVTRFRFNCKYVDGNLELERAGAAPGAGGGAAVAGGRERAPAAAAEKRLRFRALHERGTFLMPNPWDAGTAAYLERLGFQAIATTSAGFAYTRGLPDGAVARDDMIAHIREIVAATSLPVNADFEDGHGETPDDVAASVGACVATGVAGLSIEDATGDAREPLYPFDVAVARLRAARRAMDAGGADVLLTGRSEGFIVGRPDLDETIRRLVAYAEAGADCLYAPGVTAPDAIAAIVRAVAPKPVNVLASTAGPTVAALASLGVRRISVGSALARVAWGAFLAAAREILERGTFERFAAAEGYTAMNSAFRGGR